ncbi:COG1741 Pirin-related protein [Acidimicrobiia bacterium]
MPNANAGPTALPVLTLPTGNTRAIRAITTALESFEGEGFPVRRAFSGVSLNDLDPFLHMDQMGPVTWKPFQAKGTDWHPHRGFETVTYMLDGTFVHQDSNGGGGVIKPGATQWMTAGRGILHIETPPKELVKKGGLFHGIQLWVNLPARSKMIRPAYQNLEAELVTLTTTQDGQSLVRIIAGEIGGHRGPGSTHTPIVMAHASISPGARLDIPWNPRFNALAYVLQGKGFAGPDSRSVRAGQLVVFAEGDNVSMRSAAGAPLQVLLLGGEPIKEPIAKRGPFVMNTKAELAQAFDDYSSGRMGTIPRGALRPYRS